MNRGFWTAKRFCITGGAGFLGSFILEELARRGARQVFVPLIEDYDLVNCNDVRRMLADARPHVVIHLAAVVGGIGANRANPGRFFYENLMMGVQLMHESWKAGVEKFTAIGTICAYPKITPIPFKEEALWEGYPEETNAPYGMAKKMLLVQSQAYREQYGFNSIFLLPVNLYGPRDNFDPAISHVIPALIKKIYDAERAGQNEIVVWGDGSPSREFIHARDAAEGILFATERYNKSDPVNIGAGVEITIRELVEKIAELMEFKGRIVWDTTKPNGQPRRRLDTSRAEAEFGFKARTPFIEGLKEEIAWFRENASRLKL